MASTFEIISPKRNRRIQTGWEGFFPYYAGFPESFAQRIIQSACLKPRSLVLDPWNGSGTTTYAAAQLGMEAIGQDINPVMVAVARARMLAASEADSLEPLARNIAQGSRKTVELEQTDPLLTWFKPSTALVLRALERSLRKRLVGKLTLANSGLNLDHLTSLAAAFYVALFAVARDLTHCFRSSNPTWLRRPRKGEALVALSRERIEAKFLSHVCAMATALQGRFNDIKTEQVRSEIRLADSTSFNCPDDSVDMILTSPPYCTRIDYTAATRAELAVMSALVDGDTVNLSRRMIGSTRVPLQEIKVDKSWGPTCNKFLGRVYEHKSKASSGYYYQTHLDYFDKMARSLSAIAKTLKPMGVAILVAQDSYYKDVQNDLPTIIVEMAGARGLRLEHRQDFQILRTMSRINPHASAYARKPDAVEAVLCFKK